MDDLFATWSSFPVCKVKVDNDAIMAEEVNVDYDTITTEKVKVAENTITTANT